VEPAMTVLEVPQNLEAEQAVLGSILLNRDAIVAVASWLQAEYFYMQRHGQIYEAMLACYNARIPPDVRTVSEELRRRDRLEGVGGIVYLAQLVDQVPTSYHVEYYARIVERTALLRKLIDAGGKIAALGYDERDDLEITLDRAEQTLFEVSQRRNTQDFVHIGQVIDAYYEQINYLQEHRGEVVGVPTGYRDLDQITGGLQRSDLIILAARPGVGKTSLVMSLAYNVALLHQATVGVFSLEMSRDQLVQRMLAMETLIDTHRLRMGHLREDEMERVISAMGKLASAPIYIEDTAGLSITDVRSKSRRLQSQAGVDLIIIDYLQLMAGRRTDNRVQEVSEISRGLKQLARELNVPVIALSQLSRAVEGRTSHVPMLSDLRESGCLAGETLVYLPDTGTYQRIDSLVGQSGFNVLALNTETWQLEPRPVTKAFSTGRKPVFKLTTRLGRTIRATANHKFLTIHGWRRLDELGVGMELAVPQPSFVGNTTGDAPCMVVGNAHGGGNARGGGNVDDATWVAVDNARGGGNVDDATWVAVDNARGGGNVDDATWVAVDNARGGGDVDDATWVAVDNARGGGNVVGAKHSRATILIMTIPVCANASPLRHRIVDDIAHVAPHRIVDDIAHVAPHRIVDDIAHVAPHRTTDGDPHATPHRTVKGIAHAVTHRIVDGDPHAVPHRGDILWDTVAAIVPDREDEVYDLTVDGLHNFVANDITVHNSIEQDADIVMFIYREELYDPNTEKKGIAEIHIAKHRNGPVGVVPMRFDPGTTRFHDLTYRSPEGY
jgi:replicative DNA helicase